MFRYKTIKQQLAEERRKNEALNAEKIEQQTRIEELTDAVVEIAEIIAGEGEDAGEEVSENG